MDSRWISMGASCLMIGMWLLAFGAPADDHETGWFIWAAAVQLAVGYYVGKYVHSLQQMAYHDSLTGVLVNRRFVSRLNQEVETARRSKYPVTLLFIDLDNFKKYNDRHGHLEGDRLLCQFATVLQACVRRQDAVGRWGGEEFVVLLPHTDTNRGLAIGERIQKQVREELDGVTVSIGVASFPLHAADAMQLTEKADTLMYEAKKQKDCMLAATN
ncbi:GGDEF domain-containing protein [Brevibacillus choshinensis]|uniref:GGDEF domain-containing protein n=1 Tax=Brevibacillus choshinensis TaxID=54911 RepID=A0ABX7FKR3_BRECH|nr:GGDEF domain-containing protein [Brevibacillus choshinensis]QRG65590.1 GGDEF domain-containing protein [Brevibacillus choshinensis]